MLQQLNLGGMVAVGVACSGKSGLLVVSGVLRCLSSPTRPTGRRRSVDSGDIEIRVAVKLRPFDPDALALRANRLLQELASRNL